MGADVEVRLSKKTISIPRTHYALLLFGSMIVLGTSMVGPMKIYQAVLSQFIQPVDRNPVPQMVLPGPETPEVSEVKVTTDEFVEQMNELLDTTRKGNQK